MKEIPAILDAWSSDGILASVVSVRGSAYRRPGARMLVLPDGTRIGSISGGCLEGDVVKKAAWCTQAGPVVCTYDVDEFGMGCNGSVDILIERLDKPASHRYQRFLMEQRKGRKPGVIATIVRGPHLGGRLYVAGGTPWANDIDDLPLVSALVDQAREVEQHCVSRRYCTGPYEVFVEWLPAPVPLLIYGAGHDVTPLVSLAKGLGWHVTVAAARPAKFPQADQVILLPADDLTRGVDLRRDTAIVLMTHSLDSDRELLQRLLPLNPRYIGMLGPRSRRERLLAEIGGHLDARKLHAPIGLDLGGDTPETIALAIVAEIQAVITGRSAGMLNKSDHLTEDLSSRPVEAQRVG